MATVNEYNYITSLGKIGYIVKHHTNVNNSKGEINIGRVSFPKKYIGKKVCFRIEII